MLQEEIKIEKEAHKWSIRKCYQIIKTYKGQTRTDTDKTDKTRQNKKMRVMICLFFFFQNRKAKDTLILRDLTPIIGPLNKAPNILSREM